MMCSRTTTVNHQIKSIIDGMLPWIIILFLCVAAFVTALVPINSNDVWWHLKTGDYIRATGALPVTDPFSWLPATDTIDPGRPQLILRQYWLAQVLYSLVHGAFGLAGIVYLRAALCASMVLAAAVFLWRQTRSHAALLPLIAMIMVLRVIFEDSDRPHLFAFVASLLVVLLLETCVRTGRHRLLYLLPPLQLAAAQFHAGFAVGTLILCIYSACVFVEPRLRLLRRPLWLVTGLCLTFFFLNPNGIGLVPALFGSSSSVGAATSMEFRSPLTIWRYVMTEPGWLAFWGLLPLALATGGRLVKQRCWSLILVLLGLTVAALGSMRYIGFFTPVTAVLVGLELGRLGAEKTSRWVEWELAVVILASSLAMLISPGHMNRGKIHQLMQPGYFPVRAADFLAHEEVSGKIFSFDAWGGYLTYRLWPRALIFTDTRILTNDAAAEYREIINNTPTGRGLMERHQINTVVLAPLEIYTGVVYPLVRQLSDDSHWSLVHFDDTALIFMRQPHRQPVLAKEMIWFQVLRQANTWQPRFPTAPGYNRTRDEAMMRMRGG